MAKKKYIAIYKNKVHIFDNWTTCKAFVENKKNILYKGFKTPEEDELARQYIDLNIKKELPFDIQDVLYAYIDGSYRKINEEDYIGYGVAYVKNMKEVGNLHGRVQNNDKDVMNQVNGEMYAACIALQEAVKKREKRIIIVYDFMGVEAWVNGAWKINNETIQKYVDIINQLRKKISIDFIHVNSHINTSEKRAEHLFNDRADELAKMCWQKSSI